MKNGVCEQQKRMMRHDISLVLENGGTELLYIIIIINENNVQININY